MLDEEGRQCEVPVIEPISSVTEPEDRQERVRRRQKAVVLALHGGKTSATDIASETSIARTSVIRTLEQLVKLKLVECTLDGWALTIKKGKAEAQRIKDTPADPYFEPPD